jgi:putative DNA primase/helicase
MKRSTCSGNEWPIPECIGSKLPSVKSFTPAMMPEVLRNPVADLAERMQVPIDFPAVASMGCLAGAVNRRAFIRPKANDPTWMLPGNLWGALVGPPGVLAKSPVLNVAAQPLLAIEERWRCEDSSEQEKYEEQQEDFELRLAAWKETKKAKLKTKRQNEPDPIRPHTSIRRPTRRRLIINDATSAASHNLMATNPAGLLLMRDELIGWISQLDAPGREGERSLALEAWNGNTSHTIDRIERGEIHVPFCCLSVIGGITPTRLRAYLVESMKDGPTDDGLIQRFQLLVQPDIPKDFRYVDRPPSDARVLELFKRITAMNVDDPLIFHFDTDAQDFFSEWYVSLQRRLRSGELHPALASHLSKYPKLCPTIALLCALADAEAPEQRIGLGYAQQAVDWCEVLETHARRVYACVLSPQMQAAAELAEKIETGKLGPSGTFMLREVYRPQWVGLDTPLKAQTALDVLQDAAWVRRAPFRSGTGTGGGRPPDRWLVNPLVLAGMPRSELPKLTKPQNDE